MSDKDPGSYQGACNQGLSDLAAGRAPANTSTWSQATRDAYNAARNGK